MDPLVKATSLTFGWHPRQPRLFEDLSVSLEPAKIYGLLGRNGAGKTTLLKTLCGCLRPQAGKTILNVLGNAYDVAARHPIALSETALVTEAADLDNLSAARFGELAGALYPRYSQKRFREVLEALEIRAELNMASLSFGQRRKLQIAFALATNASFVCLDEPTNGLDITSQMTLRQLLIDHVAEGRTVVVSTHHVRELETILDEVIVLERGRILAQAEVDELRASRAFHPHESLESWYGQLVSGARPQESRHEHL